MNITLTMKAGPTPARTLVIAEGRKCVLGRSPSADFSFPDQQFLSSNHCAVLATRDGGQVTDLGSSNGTFVNGVRITESALKDGDELSVGHLTFLVQFSQSVEAGAATSQQAKADGPPRTPASRTSPSSLLQIGAWSFRALPAGWELIEGHGIRDANKGAFPSTIICSQDALPRETTLEQYIERQLVVIRANMPEARAKEIAPATFPPASEAALLEIELPAADGRQGIVRQFYARFGDRVGVVTFTTLASELPRVQHLFDSIRADLSFHSE
jgi:predicted component of type VI protein secretion system